MSLSKIASRHQLLFAALCIHRKSKKQTGGCANAEGEKKREFLKIFELLRPPDNEGKEKPQITPISLIYMFLYIIFLSESALIREIRG